MAFRSRSLVLGVMLPVMLAVTAVVSWGDDPVSGSDGRKLYQTHCAGCHGNLPATAKGGRSLSRIRTAVRTLHFHKQLESLPDDQLLLIALVLRDIVD